ncbi:MAG: universal stress protein [Sedimentibacter sp.]|uniref:universal stress protein n=1 Tax=Sedimentibacter sp. TaxID=1960295 RepID=UPI002980FFF8|nr:universal stress protein [Sedimentibacter sp.]MDW5299230.1 universal stress protein [Sedimentibacter sp.]
MKKVLIPVDGSAASQKAAEKAVSIGRLVNAELTFLTVVNLPTEDKYSYFGMSVENAFVANRKAMLKQLIHEETRMLNILVRNLECSDLKVDQRVIVGKVAEEIVKMAAEGNFDFIVIGRRGFSTIERFFIGSVTQKVISASPCPIMVINV